jgi:hypothetical protein
MFLKLGFFTMHNLLRKIDKQSCHQSFNWCIRQEKWINGLLEGKFGKFLNVFEVLLNFYILYLIFNKNKKIFIEYNS